MNESTANRELIRSVFKNRFKIIITSGLFFFLAMILSFLAPKKYQSSGVVYPVSSNSSIVESANPYFGNEKQADQLVQLFESNQMFDMVVNRFDLADYYKIETTDEFRYDKLIKSFNQEIKVSRSKYGSVVVTAVMEDPLLASNIVNSMISYVDTLRQNLLNANAKSLAVNLQYEVERNTESVDSILLIINGLESNFSTSEMALKETAKIEERNRNGDFKKGDALIIDALENKYSLQLAITINDYYNKLNVLHTNETDLEEIKRSLSRPFPKVYEITRAVPNPKKTSPNVTINSILGGVIGLLFSVFVLLVQLKWKQVKLVLD